MICRPWMAWSWVRSASSASRITCALRREPQSTTRTPSSRGAATTRHLAASACGGLVIHDVCSPYTRAFTTIGQTVSVLESHAMHPSGAPASALTSRFRFEWAKGGFHRRSAPSGSPGAT